MMSKNPVDHITESSFTSTSKGLMTLFLIGVIKIIIGVEFVSNEITIPWFPKITLSHLDNVIYVYWGLVLYAIYRYFLHNLPQLSQRSAYALGKYMDSVWLGRWFIERYIVGGNKAYTSGAVINAHPGYSEAKIGSYNDEYVTESFNLGFKDSIFVNKVDVSVNAQSGVTQKAISEPKLKKLWGNFIQEEVTEFEPSEEKYSLEKILSPILRLLLVIIVARCGLKAMLRAPLSFDLYLPVILNFLLLIYWLKETFFISDF